MDFSLCDRSALRRHYLSVFLTICPAVCLPVMSAGDVLPLQLAQADQLPQTVPSLKQLNARAGDMLSLSSELGARSSELGVRRGLLVPRGNVSTDQPR